MGKFLLTRIKKHLCKQIKDDIDSKDYNWIDRIIENKTIDTSTTFSKFSLLKRLFIELVQDDDEYGKGINLSRTSKRYDALIIKLDPVINYMCSKYICKYFKDKRD